MKTRQELMHAVVSAIRESSSLAVFFHTALAERYGLGATDTKTLYLLSSRGPMTAGEIAEATGITTASVTGLVDRLEHNGFVRRVRDTKDRRRVIVELNQERFRALSQGFGPVQERFAPLLEKYTDEQLATIADFLVQFVRRSKEMMESLRAHGKGAPGAGAGSPSARRTESQE